MNYLATIFVLFLITLTQKVAAENWVFVAETIDDSVKVYVEPETIRRNGDTAYYWQLAETKEGYGGKWFSVKTFVEAECNLSREKHLSIVFYTQSMGGGEATTYTPPDDDWIYNPPGSVGASAFDFACNYNK